MHNAVVNMAAHTRLHIQILLFKGEGNFRIKNNNLF